MNILTFLNTYENKQENSISKKDWNDLIFSLKDSDSINLLIEQLVEKKFPYTLIVDFYNKNYEKIENNTNIFKWSVAFHNPELIVFFYNNLKYKDIDGAINASIINFRLDNLKCLSELGINVFDDKHFSQAISRSFQPKSSNIINYYISNINKFSITEYSLNQLKNHESLSLWATHDENINTLKFLVKNDLNFNRKNLLSRASESGCLESVKYLMNNNNFNLNNITHLLKDKDIEDAYSDACQNGHLNIAKYFITSSDLENKIDPRINNSIIFRYACLSGDLELINFLLTSSKLKHHVDIHAKKDEGLIWACQNGYLEVVQYLLESNKLKEHANIHADNDKPFICSVNYDSLNIIEYFIFKKNIQKSSFIDDYLIKNKCNNVQNLFKTRDFNTKLNNDLIVNDIQKKSLKI